MLTSSVRTVTPDGGTASSGRRWRGRWPLCPRGHCSRLGHGGRHQVHQDVVTGHQRRVAQIDEKRIGPEGHSTGPIAGHRRRERESGHHAGRSKVQVRELEAIEGCRARVPIVENVDADARGLDVDVEHSTPARSFADTHTLACRSNPSRCACRGPRDVTVAVARASPSRRTRAPARQPSALRPCTEAPTIPASTADSAASRSAGPVAASAGSRPRRTSSRCTPWRIVASAAATSASVGAGAG